MRMRRFALLSMWVIACGDDVVSPAEAVLEPLCGVDGPVELVQLEDHETVGTVRRIREGGDLHVIVVTGEDAVPDSLRSLVIDPCGDEVLELSADPSYLARWGDVLVGCIESDLVRLSGYDDPSPSVLARRGCAVRRLGEQWVTLDVEPGSDAGRLLVLDVSGSELGTQRLLDDVMAGDSDYFVPVSEGRAVVQTRDLAIRSVDPRSGAITIEVEQAEPEAWSVHSDVIVYRPPVLDPEHPEPLMIRDRRTGAERTLDAEIPTSWWFGSWGEGLLTAKPMGPPIGQRWFWLDTGREVVAPAGTRIETVREDGRMWLVQTNEATGTQTFLRWREGEAPEAVWICRSCGVVPFRSEAFLEVMVQTPFANRYELWRLDDAGGSAWMMSDAVGYGYFLMDDGRVLSVIEGADYEYGPLTLSDGVGGPPMTLAPRVEQLAPSLSWAYDQPGEIVYEAVPHDGPHALYRAALAP